MNESNNHRNGLKEKNQLSQDPKSYKYVLSEQGDYVVEAVTDRRDGVQRKRI